MIVALIITVVFALFALLLGFVPDLPQMPTSVTDPLDFVADMIGSTVAIVSYILTPPLFAVLVVVMIAIFNFDYLWAAFWWILKKVPVLGVHVQK